MSIPPSLSIRAVAKRTGLSPFVIRSWEKRYGLSEPARSSGGHRLYTEAEADRLALLARAVKSGLSIGNIFRLPDSELIAILARGKTAPLEENGWTFPNATARLFAAELIEATKQFDGRRFNKVLDEAKVGLGWLALIEQVISPAAAEVGRLWQAGEVTIAQEHFFSAAVKVQLGNRVPPGYPPPNAPRIVVGTPAGQMHKTGAVITANAATHLGWEVAYVGAGLPAEELAGAVQTFKAKALAISITFPRNDPMLQRELVELGRLVPEGTRIIAGGQAVHSYVDSLCSIGAVFCGPLSEFISVLSSIA